MLANRSGVALVVALAASACGRLHFDPRGDGGGDGAQGSDATLDGGFRGKTETYVKASNTDAGDLFAGAVAISADGNTLAIGAALESSAATGVDGNQADNSATNSGAVYIYTRVGPTWAQQAYVKASNTGALDTFGAAVALSADGNTLAVGATSEASIATGIDGNQLDDSTTGAGAVYVFTRVGTTWSQQAYIKASNTAFNQAFGFGLALSADGNTLAVGAAGESSNATGIDGNQANTSANSAGAVYVFARVGATWSQQAYVKASNTAANVNFGFSVALSDDGNTLAVGQQYDSSNATGIDGNDADTSAPNSGAVFVFTRAGVTWSQQAYIKASNTGMGDKFGYAVASSGDGNTLAVGAFSEASAATGVDGDQLDNSRVDAGAVYVFTRIGATWSQQAYVKASNTAMGATFGFSVALSADGSTLEVGAGNEANNATGINGNQASGSAPGAGAAYVFARAGVSWSQLAYVKASNTAAFDAFGYTVAISDDATTLLVGAYRESSNATGIDGDQADTSANQAGAAYVIE